MDVPSGYYICVKGKFEQEEKEDKKWHRRMRMIYSDPSIVEAGGGEILSQIIEF